MKKTDDERDAAAVAKLLALMCFRNTFLEDLHAGKVPVSKTGDYSDVKVIDGQGREIPWAELSRLDDAEMKQLMKQVVNRIFTFLARMDDESFRAALQRWGASVGGWDSPEIDAAFARMIQERA